MISLRFETDRLKGRQAGIYGFASDGLWPSARGCFKLWPEDDYRGDPALEGDSAIELEVEAKRLGAGEVNHWYLP